MPGSLVAVVERLDDEMFKSLQVLPNALHGIMLLRDALTLAPSGPAALQTCQPRLRMLLVAGWQLAGCMVQTGCSLQKRPIACCPQAAMCAGLQISCRT